MQPQNWPGAPQGTGGPVPQGWGGIPPGNTGQASQGTTGITQGQYPPFMGFPPYMVYPPPQQQSFSMQEFHPSKLNQPLTRLATGMNKEQVRNFFENIDMLVPKDIPNRDECLIQLVGFHIDPLDVDIKRFIKYATRVNKGNWEGFKRSILYDIANSDEGITPDFTRAMSLLRTDIASMSKMKGVAEELTGEVDKAIEAFIGLLGQPSTVGEWKHLVQMLLLTQIVPAELNHFLLKTKSKTTDDLLRNLDKVCNDWKVKYKDEGKLFKKHNHSVTVMSIQTSAKGRDRSVSRDERRGRSKSQERKVCTSQMRNRSREAYPNHRSQSRERSYSRGRERSSMSRDRNRSSSRGRNEKWEFADKCYDVVKTYTKVERDEIKADEAFERYKNACFRCGQVQTQDHKCKKTCQNCKEEHYLMNCSKNIRKFKDVVGLIMFFRKRGLRTVEFEEK